MNILYTIDAILSCEPKNVVEILPMTTTDESLVSIEFTHHGELHIVSSHQFIEIAF